MNLKKTLALALLLCAGLLPAAAQQDVRICVASDVHVMAPSLMKADGKAYADYMSNDRKMLKESPALLDALRDRLLAEKPAYVWITGDLTKDGERVSHEYLVEHMLNPLRQAGIKVLVVPGNHDVRNPHAVEFDGDKTRRVPTVSRAEFAEIYRNFGYGDALARDTASLSYVYQLTPGTRILALDACEPYRNDFATDKAYHQGVFVPATLAFAQAQLEAARKAGDKVIVMLHHGITEHWKYQNRVLPGYVADNAPALIKILRRYGVHAVFTGHLHTQDITEAAPGLYDIETGSLVSYASPYRDVTISGDSLFVTTQRIESVPGLHLDRPFPEYAREHTAAGVRSIVGRMFPATVPADLKKQCVEVVAQAMMDNYRGGETLTKEREAQIDSLAKQLKHYTFKYSIVFKRVTKALLTDLKPGDETLRIKY